jgi:hypothetical protein
MKVDKQILERMREAIAPLDTPERRARYIARDIPRAHTVKDIDVRYSHDLLWTAVNSGGITYREIERYNDTHISTALRRIVPKLVAA